MLKGEHVYLRAVERSDLETLLAWRNRPENRRFFREYRELNKDNQMQWFDKIVMGDRNTLMFSIVRPESDELLGACGLCYIDWVNRSADFSIYIGAGDLYIDDRYADDAGRLMMQYGFHELGLHRLWSEIYDFDDAKKLFFDRLGFTLDGRLRETHWAEGKWHDSLFYGLLEQEYQNNNR
ncbi:GNAT family N-acetyltransferase [Paenibacillus oenotherae]|uniref:GNAT family N-acetyltransferase n=1 Tax=Paenibacillus oenotherae TaxID=1435645 RepID=A0ABS7D4Y9_9BACL|nr:GNAT family protein [Paenibacillus oenotherae]MBW7474978.1 GNAT family N-acetyltransferase [Paenibacillus oenotherae]